jgi:cyanophycin synthetase
MTDTSTNAAVFSVSDPTIIESGLPFDRFDALVVAGDWVQPYTGHRAEAFKGRIFDIAALTGMLLPACRGPVLVKDTAAYAAQVKRVVPKERVIDVADKDDLAAAAVAALGEGTAAPVKKPKKPAPRAKKLH